MSRRYTRRTLKKRRQRQKANKRRRTVKGGFFFQSKNKVMPEGCYADNINHLTTSSALKDQYQKCCSRKHSFFRKEPKFCEEIKKKLTNSLISEENVNCDFEDINAIETSKNAHAHYLKCCPKQFKFFKNRSSKCKKLEAKYKELDTKDENKKFGKTVKEGNMYYQEEPDDESS